jgi:hypothetical protein
MKYQSWWRSRLFFASFSFFDNLFVTQWTIPEKEQTPAITLNPVL